MTKRCYSAYITDPDGNILHECVASSEAIAEKKAQAYIKAYIKENRLGQVVYDIDETTDKYIVMEEPEEDLEDD